jgi:GTP cyclohydrolase I
VGDVQDQTDAHGIAIPAVGIAPVALPLRYRDEVTGAIVPIDAECALLTDLAAERRGTRMSRLTDVLEEGTQEPVTASALLGWLEQAVASIGRGTSTARIALRFRYHLAKAAPVSGATGYVPYPVELRASRRDRERVIGWAVSVLTTTLCPCSQQTAARGAHNQRCRIMARVSFRTPRRFPSLAAFLAEAEQLASCPVFSSLEQPDEKSVTEAAWDHPMFVEDVLRDGVAWLSRREDVAWFALKVVSEESIHPHNAVACYDGAAVAASAASALWGWDPWE